MSDDLLESAKSELRKKATDKLNVLFNNPNALIPDLTVVEQASGEVTAEYVSSLIESENRLADITAGLGINTYFFALKAKTVVAVEKESSRAEILKHNLKILGVKNVVVVNSDCVDWLRNCDFELDCIYADPSRRDSHNRRVKDLSDYSPDLHEVVTLANGRCKRILVKVSPMLDIHKLYQEFPQIKAFHLLEVHKEVKEIILDLELDMMGCSSKNVIPPLLYVAILTQGKAPIVYKFSISDKLLDKELFYLKGKESILSGQYLYEPSAALMKASMFGALSKRFDGLKKLAHDTHFFISDNFYPSFPGKIFEVKEILNSARLKRLRGSNANVISRNHPSKANELQAKFKLKPSDTDYIIACKAGKDKVILSAKNCKV